MALPEVLCQPGKEGKPLVMDYDGNVHELDASDYEYETEDEESSETSAVERVMSMDDAISQKDIEVAFEANIGGPSRSLPMENLAAASNQDMNAGPPRKSSNGSSEGSASGRAPSPLPPRPQDSSRKRRPLSPEEREFALSDARLDELLSNKEPDKPSFSEKKMHRRSLSAPNAVEKALQRNKAMLSQATAVKPIEEKGSGNHRSGGGSLVRVNSFGEVHQEQPSLLDQARLRAATFDTSDKASERQRQRATSPKTLPIGRPRTRKKLTDVSLPVSSSGGALSHDDVDRSYAVFLKKEKGFDNVGWSS